MKAALQVGGPSAASVSEPEPVRGPWLPVGLLVAVACGLLALLLGQDANWDLRNYHFYNPYAWLHGRMGHDLLAAQVAAFYNPLFHVPVYWAVSTLPPKLVGFLFGFVQGLNFIPLAYIAGFLAPRRTDAAVAPWLCTLTALVGLTGAGFISELGTSFGDNVLSLFVLTALGLVLAASPRLVERPRVGSLALVLLAGLLSGLAAGLKQPAAVFAVGLCGAFLFMVGPFPRRVGLAFCFGIGVLAGMAATSGFWMLDMWRQFGNPLFPYFNHFFQSPMGSPADYRDARFLPKSVWQVLLFPFYFAVAPAMTAEAPFRDVRFPLLYLLLAGLLVRWIVVRVQSRQPLPTESDPDRLDRSNRRYLLAAGLLAYLTWLKLFGIYRYLVPLEMLVPLGLWLALDRLIPSNRARLAALLAALAAVAVSAHPADWGRVSWSDDYFGVRPPALADPAHTIVLMTGVEPTAYVIPFFPPAVRFIRIQSYFTGPSDTPNGFDRLMRRIVDEHDGPMYVLYRNWNEVDTLAALKAYGLELRARECDRFAPHIEDNLTDPLLFCPVVKARP